MNGSLRPSYRRHKTYLVAGFLACSGLGSLSRKARLPIRWCRTVTYLTLCAAYSGGDRFRF